MIAAMKGNPNTVKVLLQAGSKVNTLDFVRFFVRKIFDVPGNL